MKVDKLHVFLLALFMAGCASQPTQTQKAPVAQAAAANKSAQATTTAAKEDTGAFHKVVRDGKTLYCDPTPRTGSRMSKPFCLDEDQYAVWKEKNDALKEDMRRGSTMTTTDNRDPGPR